MKALLALLLLVSFSVEANQLLFKMKNKDVMSLSIDAMKSGTAAKVKASDVSLYNADRGYQRTYQGYDLFAMLDSVYGKSWRSQKKITFTAADGSSQFVQIKDMIKAAQNKKGYLAYSEKGKNGFTFIEKSGHKIDPAHLYLVWSNFSTRTPASSAPALKWPYQMAVISID